MPLKALSFLVTGASIALSAQPAEYGFEDGRKFLRTHCQACHVGKSAVGGFAIDRVDQPASLKTDAQKWLSLNRRVHNGEMPPKGAPSPSFEIRERFTNWVATAIRTEVCSLGPWPGASPIRRLNRDEYTATLRDLLDIHLDMGQQLPVDGAGGEGFDNAAETLFLSPLHSEKYMEAARFAMDFAAKEYKSRTKILIASPGKGVTEDRAARQILAAFLPRAFRRPVADSEIVPYLDLFRAARKKGQIFETAIFFTLRGVLVSPFFLFRVEPANTTGEPRPLDSYSLASRISYFLWGSLPDELLFDVAAAGGLHDGPILQQLIPRMLRNDRALGFAQRFTEQWLHTRELMGDKAPDAKLYPAYAADEELRSDIRLQPVLFFREVFAQNLSLLSFLESTHTIGTSNLNKHYGIKMPIRQNASKQPQWVELPLDSHRGGLLGMSAVLSVASYPYRTSPVLRGTWILESILGTPPPPPPPNVPALEESKEGAPPKSVRERLTRHRENPVCASCHSRIDPLGFALENYDPIGRWRTEESGKPVDASGELPDGTKIDGPEQLKTALLARKDVFVRNLATKMLGYALGRGLTIEDSCAVDAIVDEVKRKDYRAHALIEAIVMSAPFRTQAAAKVVTVTRKETAKP